MRFFVFRVSLRYDTEYSFACNSEFDINNFVQECQKQSIIDYATDKENDVCLNNISITCICYLENQQFAGPSTYNKLYCRGRPCASCGKCRDWCFNGDSSTWNWIRDWKNWGKDDRKRYKNDRVYLRFKHRDGSKCDSHALHAPGYAAYGDAGCLCENNFHD